MMAQGTPGGPRTKAGRNYDGALPEHTTAVSMLDRAPAPLPHRRHQRNAKLQLSVTLAAEPVAGLYLNPQHRRRRHRPDVMGADHV